MTRVKLCVRLSFSLLPLITSNFQYLNTSYVAFSLCGHSVAFIEQYQIPPCMEVAYNFPSKLLYLIYAAILLKVPCVSTKSSNNQSEFC